MHVRTEYRLLANTDIRSMSHKYLLSMPPQRAQSMGLEESRSLRCRLLLEAPTPEPAQVENSVANILPVIMLSSGQRDHNERRPNAGVRKKLAWRTSACRWWQNNLCKKGKDYRFACVDEYGFDWHATGYSENNDGSEFILVEERARPKPKRSSSTSATGGTEEPKNSNARPSVAQTTHSEASGIADLYRGPSKPKVSMAHAFGSSESAHRRERLYSLHREGII